MAADRRSRALKADDYRQMRQHVHPCCRGPGRRRAVGATFALRVPLPSRFNGKYDPASRPPSTPTLLKSGDRRRFTNPGKTGPKWEPKPQSNKEGLSGRGQERHRKRRGNPKGPRQRSPEYKEASRRAANRLARKVPRNSGSAGTAANRPSRTRPAARHAPRTTGSRAGRTTPREGKRRLP